MSYSVTLAASRSDKGLTGEKVFTERSIGMVRKMGTIPFSDDILERSGIGLWAYEIDNGETPRECTLMKRRSVCLT